MPVSRAHFIPPADQVLLDHELRVSDFRIVKAALQRLCDFYESGRILSDLYFSVARTLPGLLWVDDVEVRRWTLKAVAVLKDTPTHLGALLARLRDTDDDPENVSWGIAALFSIADAEQIAPFLEERTIPIQGATFLASKLYPNAGFERFGYHPIDIAACDDLTLRWISLLFGYGRIEERFFHPRFDNLIVVRELNAHHEPKVAEYAVWSLHRNPDCKLSDLGFYLYDISGKPQNVRRWVNRLLSKDEDTLQHHLDLAGERARDPEPKAREGLALGMKQLWFPGIDGLVLPWYARESDERVRDILLEHMARNAGKVATYREEVISQYGKAGAGNLRRERLEAAAGRTPLFSELRRISIAESQAADLFGSASPSSFYMSIDMSQNKQAISAGRDVKVGGSVAGRDIRAEVRTSIEGSDQLSHDQKSALFEALQLAAALQDSSQKTAVEFDVKGVAEQPSSKSVQTLLDRLKQIRDAAVYGDELASRIRGVIEQLSGCF